MARKADFRLTAKGLISTSTLRSSDSPTSERRARKKSLERSEMDDSLDPVNTCGICETIVNEAEIINHSCVIGYPNIIVDPNSRYFYPQCENGGIISKSVLSGGVEGIVSEPRIIQQNTGDNGDPHSQATSFFHKSGDLDERLIEEVRKHEPLYNFRLLLSQRG